MSENNDKPDFMPIGQALKRAREARGVTREQLAGIIDKAPRHIQAIENEGQLPSVELLFQLALRRGGLIRRLRKRLVRAHIVL